jgi:hypothetical protein
MARRRCAYGARGLMSVMWGSVAWGGVGSVVASVRIVTVRVMSARDDVSSVSDRRVRLRNVYTIRYGPGMSEEQIEPGEMTERFRKFSESVDPEPSRTLPAALLVVGAVVVVGLIVVVWLLFAR